MEVRSLTLPNNGTGFGPGGSDAAEALGFRSQMKTTRRRPAEATRTGVEGIAQREVEEGERRE